MSANRETNPRSPSASTPFEKGAGDISERCGQCQHYGRGRQGGRCIFEAHATWCPSSATCKFTPSRYKNRF